MEFKYKNEDSIESKCDNHQRITLYKGINEFYLYVDDIEFELSSENLHGLFVVINKEFKSLRDVYFEAEDQFEKIMGEAKQELLEEEEHQRQLRADYYEGVF